MNASAGREWTRPQLLQLLASSSGVLANALPTLGSANRADSVNSERIGAVDKMKSNMPMYLYQFQK